jgi:RNA polymerase sigma-70 factor, ECF subfamily
VRPRLFAIGYRMLASVQEAEDLVQDVWLRCCEDAGAFDKDILNPEAWLVTVTTRMAIDRLRAAKIRRESYPGIWLPEPLLTSGPTTPEQARERAEEVSIAFLVLLDLLAPEARAAFLLREVFEVEYEQIAMAIGKSEAATRQIVHRAKQRIDKAQGENRREAAAPRAAEQLDLLRRLVQAISQGEFQSIQGLLAEEAELLGDFGNVKPSLAGPMRGGRRIAQLYFASHLRHGANMRLKLARLNGEWSLLRFIGADLDSVQAFELDGGRISRIRIQRNPQKLAILKQQLARLH